MLSVCLNKKIIFYIAGPLLFVLSISCLGKLYAAVVDKIVAVVNEEVITQSEVDQLLLPIILEYQSKYEGKQLYEKIEQAKKQVVDRLIEDRLILQEAKRQQTQVDEQEVAQRLDEVITSFPSEQDFQEELSKQSLTVKVLTDKYKEQLMGWKLINKEIRPKISVSPSEIAAYYNSHLEEFNVKDSVRLRHILIRFKPDKSPKDTEQRARKVYNLLKRGADFEKLAQRYSQGPGNTNGGDMGYVQKGDMLKQIDEVVFKLEIGQISELLKTDLGYHIFKIEDKKQSQTEPLANVQDKIRNIIFKEKFNVTYQDWINKLKQNAYIQIR